MTGVDTLNPSVLPMEFRAPMEAGGPPVQESPQTKLEEGQALAEQLQDPEVINDPAAVEAFFEENAEQLQDPDVAAGFIQSFEPDYLQAIVGQFAHASAEQQVAFVEHLSDALGAASHSDQLSAEWVDGLFSGAAEHTRTRWAVGQLMRSGDFSTGFLTQAMREVVVNGDAYGPVTWSLGDSSYADNGLGWIMDAVARNPEAAALTTAAFAGELMDNPNVSDADVARVFEVGTVDYRTTDPGMAEYAARQVIGEVDAREGKLPPGYDDAMAAIATEYFDDIAYAANSPVDIPLDQQDTVRDGIEMPFSAAHHLLYAAGGASPDALGELMVAMGEWQDGLLAEYGGDPNLSSAYGRELGAMEAMLSGSIASRLIDDGKAADADNAAAREGLGILLNAIETKGSSLTGAAKSAVKELITDALIPKSDEQAQARADYVDEVVAHRRDAFRDAANYLLVNPSNLEAYTLGQNPPVTVDISPAATIQAYEQRLMAEYAEMGNWGFTVDADFTVPDGNGGLQIMPLEDMSAAQRGAYVEWISTPEVQQVLLQQVNSQNQAHDDVPFGMGD